MQLWAAFEAALGGGGFGHPHSASKGYIPPPPLLANKIEKYIRTISQLKCFKQF